MIYGSGVRRHRIVDYCILIAEGGDGALEHQDWVTLAGLCADELAPAVAEALTTIPDKDRWRRMENIDTLWSLHLKAAVLAEVTA